MPAGLRTTTLARLIGTVRDGIDDVLGRGPVFGLQDLGRHIDPQGLRGYYCDFRHKARFDARHPGFFADFVIPTAQTALGYWELMLDGEDTREPFLERAEWLMRRARPARGGPGMVWYCDRPLHKYDLRSDWITAMGQSEAISVLLRAHSLTGEERYLELAQAAFDPFMRDVARGGVTRRIDGHLVLEEYATARPAAILNGWIFALFGVHELAVATGNCQASTLFEESCTGLIAMLPRYDCGWWSLYSLYDHGRPDLAKPFYQRLHPILLEALNMLRPDARLMSVARRWRRQRTARATARVVADKIVFRFAWERSTAEDDGAGVNGGRSEAAGDERRSPSRSAAAYQPRD